jgi:hypothetical protein
MTFALVCDVVRHHWHVLVPAALVYADGWWAIESVRLLEIFLNGLIWTACSYQWLCNT